MIVFVLCMGIAACSGGLYDFDSGGSSKNNVKVDGTLLDITTNDPDRDVVVFVYTGICETKKANPDVCDNLLLPEDLPLLKSKDYTRVVHKVVSRDPLGESFRVKKVRKGNITIVYLQDKAKNRDRRIDPEDITITRDAMNNIIPAADNAVSMHTDEGRFMDVPKKTTVDLEDVTIDFPFASATDSVVPTTTTTSTSTSHTVYDPTMSTIDTTSTVPVTTTLAPIP